MLVKISVLTALSLLLFVSGCSTCEPKIEYVDRVVYITPEVPNVLPTEEPSVTLKVWGDYKVYKQQCQAQISLCNVDKQSILTAISDNTK